ncbi:MAG: ABC transporter permease [Sphingobium sp.]|nr:ABC transporter permease [Sphingobium sp.]MBP8670809.1 ABC transporter permease [Sphingobium sp.]MBP9158128.1 ABC transporter permease [Sphingobium sp.]
MTDIHTPAGPLPMPEPGVPRIRNVNWSGTWALYTKEVRRFMKVQLQTIWAPSITTLLYLIIFTVALGGESRRILGAPFADFIAPGLIMMGMIQNAFANASFGMLVGKIQGTIVDYLMPPISTAELLFAQVAAAMTRAAFVGIAIAIAIALWPGVHIILRHGWAIIAFWALGTMFVSLLGVLTSIWAEKFDHAAAVTNFVIAPLSLLSGTFYSVDRLAPAFQAISHANPFFYAISGFRYGFLSAADTEVERGLAVLGVLNVILAFVCYRLLKSGWKIRP